MKNNRINLNLIPLAWPIFIEGLTAGFVSFADTFFLSKISDEVASSVGMVGAVLLIGFWLLPQFTAAGTSIASQYIGANDKEHILPTYLGNIVISTLFGSALGLFLFVFSFNIGKWLGMTDIQNNHAGIYLQIISVNFIFVGLRFSYASILASKTLTKWNMVVTVITNVMNILLNRALMTGFWIFPALGIRGIALATVISYASGFLILLPIVHIKLGINFFKKEILNKFKEVIMPILRIGIPAALEPFSYTFQNLLISAIVIKLGVVAMSANTYILRLLFVDITVSWSLTMAGQIIISHLIGAGKTEEVYKTFWKIVVYSMSFAVVNLIIYLVFHKTFLSIFTDDPEIIRVSFWILFICLFMEPIRAINILGGVILKSVGDGKFSVALALIGMWGLIPVILLVSHLGFGIIGLWTCMLIDETLRAGVNVWRWQQGKWRTMSVIKSKKTSGV